MLNIPNLVCCWDFSSESPYVSIEGNEYTLKEGNGPHTILSEGVIGSSAIEINEGQYLFVHRSHCKQLNIYGKHAQVSVLAWIKRKQKSYEQCEAIAGIWNETMKKRQYCLFLNLRLFESADQVCGHISGSGGATSGQQWCTDASIGKTQVKYDEWCFVAFTYDGQYIRSYLNGNLDERMERNPFAFNEGIFNGGVDGADFTVGAVDRQSEMGNYFAGLISGLAVFDRALNSEEIKAIHLHFPLTGNKS